METRKADLVFLTEPRSRNPLANMDDLKELVEGMPRENPLALLQQLAIWLSDIATLPDCTLSHRLEVIDLIDQLAKNHQVRLVPEYLETTRMRKLTESDLWVTAFAFLRDLGEAYMGCLARFQAGEEKSEVFRDKLPMVTCRILRTLTLQMKWTYLRYGKPEDRVWRDLGRAYLLAGNWGFAVRRAAVYPGKHGESSVQEELLKALMLSVSSLDALTPMQQHIAERVVAHFGGRFALHTTPGPGCSFKFDIAMHVAPTRAARTAAAAPMTRFFGQGTAIEGLRLLLLHLRQRGALPTDTGIGDNYPAPEVEAVMRHLERCWDDTPAPRRARRMKSYARHVVVPGLEASMHWLEESTASDTARHPTLQRMESWIVLDVSDGGCRAVIPAEPSDWLEVGALLCARSEADGSMRMGVVRRMAPDPDGKHEVGIEYLGEQALLASVYPTHLGGPAAQSHKGRPAVLLSRKPDDNGWVELLLLAEGFNNQRHLRMNVRGRNYTLEQTALHEHGKDHVRVAYSIAVLDHPA